MKKSTVSTFAINVFNARTMQKYLDKSVIKSLELSINSNKVISLDVAEKIAQGMMAWAIENDVTHYTHWFQPLTGATAEKHDAFLSLDKYLEAINQFDGKQLVQQEPDASSFPNGGIRNTFEARGYTAWDPSSPAFIYNDTLCIPTIFISYTGEALDYKAPLIRSIEAINNAATAICKIFNPKVSKVRVTLGWEQEYFLIDRALYEQRLDLKICKRTLFGKSAEKGQIMEDHYFGSIPQRVQAYMKDLEINAWKLGIPVKTRHNEVAPNQFELAPIFEEVNIAIDHNQLLMDLMQKIAENHDLVVLFHEKPFGGINGSGKHNNWSMATNTGVNLLSPGKSPETNLQFLTFFINIIKAVHDHADLLRASIASAGNDHRLGANEAPPAIMSVFIGSYLSEILKRLDRELSDKKPSDKGIQSIKDHVSNIPFIFDNTDRNRTSPFAFTGNKFEFRAVGSSANSSLPMQILNTIVANQLIEFKEEFEKILKKNENNVEMTIFIILKKYINACQNILFEGNGYSEAWVKEAKKRGLSNHKTTPEALKSFVSNSSKQLFQKLGVITPTELEARYEIELERYINLIDIETKVMEDMIYNQIIPSVIGYENLLLQNINAWKNITPSKSNDQFSAATLSLLKDIASHRSIVLDTLLVLKKEKEKSHKSIEQKALFFANKVVVVMQTIRTAVDKLELLTDEKSWTLPKYKDLLSSF